MELAIGPVPQAWSDVCKESLPDGKTIKISSDPYSYRKSYAFNQAADPFSSKMQFNIEKTADVRVLATYNFLQADLALTIANNASGTVLMYGDSGSNYENLGPIRLQPGLYDLTVFEPLRLPTGIYFKECRLDCSNLLTCFSELRRCVKFELSIWAAVAESNENADNYGYCSELDLPSTFDTPAYLSTISGKHFHYVTNYLVSTKGRKDSVNFHVSDDSVIRIYLPALAVLDVDISLSSGNLIL